MDQNLPFSCRSVKIDEDDLLPGAQGECTIQNRHNKAGSKHGRPDMGMTVPVMPAEVVGILDVLRDKAFQCIGEVLQQSWFILDARDSGGGSYGEDSDHPVPDPGSPHYPEDLVRDVLDIHFFLGFQVYVIVMMHGVPP